MLWGGLSKEEILSPALAPLHLQQAGELALRSSELESWSCPSLAAALGRAGPVLALSSTVEVALDTRVAGDLA